MIKRKPPVKEKPTTMLFKPDGVHEFHGGKFDYIVVESDNVEDHLKSGWFRTTCEATASKAEKVEVSHSKEKKAK